MLYNSPGVYVEEYLTPTSDVAADPGDAAAAFVGTSSGGGPVGPVQVTSWNQYQTLFGAVAHTNDDLALAVYTFFLNGGPGCFVVRAINADATASTLQVVDGVAPIFDVNASAPGSWGNDVSVTVTPHADTSNRFDLSVLVGGVREQFIDLTLDPSDGRYAPDIVNSATVGSKYVKIAMEAGFVWDPATPVVPDAVTADLAGGTDGTGSPDLAAAVERLDSVDRNLVVNVPAASTTVLTDVVNWAATGGRHFVVADVPKPAGGETEAASVLAQTGFADAVPPSSHVAVYGPWLYVSDPGSRSGALRLTAPGGAVVGQYLRTDMTRGVHKAPSGTQTSLNGVVAPYTNYTTANQDALHASSVNLIKRVPGAGVCIWGTRTKGRGFPDRYVPVRRLLISLRSSLTSITRFAVFENNDEELWNTIEAVVDSFLQQQFDLGALKGSDPSQAYYVICDESNNSPADADAGIVNVTVGVALKNPAEFIVIRLGQTASGSTVTDSLEEE